MRQENHFFYQQIIVNFINIDMKNEYNVYVLRWCIFDKTVECN